MAYTWYEHGSITPTPPAWAFQSSLYSQVDMKADAEGSTRKGLTVWKRFKSHFVPFEPALSFSPLLCLVDSPMHPDQEQQVFRLRHPSNVLSLYSLVLGQLGSNALCHGDIQYC